MKNIPTVVKILSLICLIFIAITILTSCSPEERVEPVPEIPFLFTVEQIGNYVYVDYDQSPKVGWKLYKAPTEAEVKHPDLNNPHLGIITGNGTGCTALKSTAYWWYNCHRVVSDDGEIDHTICLH